MGGCIRCGNKGLRCHIRHPGARDLPVNQAGVDARENSVHMPAFNLLFCGYFRCRRCFGGFCLLRRLFFLYRLVGLLERANTFHARLMGFGNQALESRIFATGAADDFNEHRHVDARDNINIFVFCRESSARIVGTAAEEIDENKGFFRSCFRNDARVLFDQIFRTLPRKKCHRIHVIEVSEDHAGGLQKSGR